MRVSKNDYIRLNQIEHLPVTFAELMKFAKYVTNDHPLSFQSLDTLFWKPPEAVVITFDRQNRRDCLKLFDDIELPDVACVDYRVDFLKDRNNRPVEQAVSIGYHAYLHYISPLVYVRCDLITRREAMDRDGCQKTGELHFYNSPATTELSLSRAASRQTNQFLWRPPLRR